MVSKFSLLEGLQRETRRWVGVNRHSHRPPSHHLFPLTKKEEGGKKRKKEGRYYVSKLCELVIENVNEKETPQLSCECPKLSYPPLLALSPNSKSPDGAPRNTCYLSSRHTGLIRFIPAPRSLERVPAGPCPPLHTFREIRLHSY